MRRLGPQTATKHKNKTNSEKKQEWCFPGINKKRFIFPLDFFSKKKKTKTKNKTKQKKQQQQKHPKTGTETFKERRQTSGDTIRACSFIKHRKGGVTGMLSRTLTKAGALRSCDPPPSGWNCE